MEFWITLIFGGGAGAVLLYLMQRLFEHRLAKDLSASDRQASAARDFRAKVNEALTHFHKPEVVWQGDNRTANAMRNFVSSIDLAAKDYVGLCSGFEKTKFTDKWQETKNYCSTTLPRAVTGNPNFNVSEQDAKTTFLKLVNELLSIAKT